MWNIPVINGFLFSLRVIAAINRLFSLKIDKEKCSLIQRISNTTGPDGGRLLPVLLWKQCINITIIAVEKA